VLTVHGAYARDEIEALLDAYDVDLLLFPTVWPETFSYTLSEGWMAHRAALVPPRGALAERVAASGAGWLIQDWPDMDSLVDQLMRLTAPAHRLELERRNALAAAVFTDKARDIAATPDLYGDLADEPRAPMESRTARYEIYASACHALGVAPLAAAVPTRNVAPPTAVHRIIRMLRGRATSS
jgi:hypothetical protein